MVLHILVHFWLRENEIVPPGN